MEHKRECERARNGARYRDWGTLGKVKVPDDGINSYCSQKNVFIQQRAYKMNAHSSEKWLTRCFTSCAEIFLVYILAVCLHSQHQTGKHDKLIMHFTNSPAICQSLAYFDFMFFLVQ